MLFIALIVLAACVAAYFWHHHRRSGVANRPTAPELSAGLANPSQPTQPLRFGYKTAWLAFHTEDLDGVAKALGLQNIRKVNWEYGVFHANEYNDYQIFVTPPVNGWILAMGVPMVWDADEHATERMVELSKQFGEVQFFASMRTSDSYFWEKAVKGKLLRSFREEEGARRTFGDESDEEKQLGKFSDPSSPESRDPNYWERKDLVFPDERIVLKVAALWSVDPSQFDRMGLPKSLGLLGDPSATYPPKPEPIRPR